MRLFLLAAVAGCNEYGFHSPGDDPEAPADSGEVQAPPDPDVAVAPEAVALVVCGVGSATVTVRNDGAGELTVSALEITGDGWSIAEQALPLALAPGEARELALTAGPGEATLTVRSDDPDEPEVAVALSAVADGPPTASIVAPDTGAVLATGAPVTVRGQVWDDVDPPSSLGVRWTSSVDGTLSIDPADASGETTHTWTASPGPHTLGLEVVDTCGNVASDAREVCQQAGYDADELGIDSWHFEGAARWDTSTDWLELTPALTGQVGTAFQTSAAVSGDNVRIRFSFYIGGGTGADGISLTALDTARMTTFLGGTGCGIGYGGDAPCTAGPALPGWSIEVDTYFNDGQDPTAEDHVMFTFDGDVDDPAAWAVLPEMEDNGWHTMIVDVAAPHVRVAIDGTIYLDQDLSGHFGFPAYVGFTAGTGGSTNNHWIDALTVTDYVCD